MEGDESEGLADMLQEVETSDLDIGVRINDNSSIINYTDMNA